MQREEAGDGLSNKRNGVICLAKPEISLIKVVRTVVWETMVAGNYGRLAKVRSVDGKGRGRGGFWREGEEGRGADAREVKRGGRWLPVLTPAKAVQ